MNNSTNWSWGAGLDDLVKEVTKIKLIINTNNIYHYETTRQTGEEPKKG